MTDSHPTRQSASQIINTSAASSSHNSSRSRKDEKIANPFRIPEDHELFAMREQQKRERERGTNQSAPKSLAARNCQPTRTNFRYLTEIEEEKASPEEDALSKLILSPDSNQVQEGLREFIGQKRDIFLAQLEIDTKREELKRLEDLEREEETSLRQKEAEINLFRDQFRAFLENDGKATTEARRAAEEKSKQRIEVSMKYKAVSSQISNLRSEIAHSDEKLQECEDYKQFLESLTPTEWRKEHPLPELYFKKPDQLLEIMKTLEEQNMFLIRHCQDAEEVVERYRTRFNEMLKSRDGSITSMLSAKEEKKQQLNEMTTQNDEYKVTGEFHFGNELSDAELSELQREIAAFHQQLGFDTASSNDTPTMLRHIEERMEQLTHKLKQMNSAVVAELANEKGRKRREMQRAEKAAQKAKEQEEKMQRALALATMPIKRKTGRPIYPRMAPEKAQTREKREEKLRKEQAQAQADEDLLFGQIWD